VPFSDAMEQPAQSHPQSALFELEECCHRLKLLRLATEPDGAGHPRNIMAEGEVLSLMDRLSKIAISREWLKETGVGREVNHAFYRLHASTLVRERSRSLVASWKVQIQAAGAAPFARAPGTPKRPRRDSREPRTERRQSKRRRSAPSEDVSEWTVKQLMCRIQELGLSVSGCLEKSELVALLRKQPSASARPQTAKRLSKGRLSFGRRSMLRRQTQTVQEAASPGTSCPDTRAQLAAIQRILQAKDDLAVLELRHVAVPRAELERMVLRRCREMYRFVHPDKCAPELQELATRGFQRLEAAKEKVLGSAAEPQARAGSPGGMWSAWGGR